MLGSYIEGLTLDVGAGEYDRYSNSLGSRRCVRLDIRFHRGLDVVADAHNLPFKEGSFDSLVCTHVLTALREPYTATYEFHRVLKQGGIVLLAASQTDAIQGEPFDYWRFTRFGLEQLCRSSGLNIMLIKQRGGYFSMAAQQLIRYCIHRFDPYNRRTVGRLLKWPLATLGRFLMALDRLDTSEANRKHTIGWLVLAKKQP